MKITVDIDCTPEEARAFLGLPDVQPMQEALMQDMQERLTANLHAMEPSELMKMWLPSNLKAFEGMMDAFARMGGKRD